MKKITLFFTALFISGMLAAQLPVNFLTTLQTVKKAATKSQLKAKVWLLDSTYEYTGQDSSWIEKEKYIVLNRDAARNETNSISYRYDTTAQSWIKKDTIEKAYYSNDTLKFVLIRPWNTATNQWDDTLKYEEYDQDGKLIKLIEKTWDYDNNIFTYGYRGQLIFSGNTAENVIRTLDTATGQWNPSYKLVITFDNNYNITEQAIYAWTGNQWLGIQKNIYTYDSNGRIISELEQSYNFTTFQWENSSQNLYSYDANGNKIERVYQQWNSSTSQWVNVNRDTMSYNSNNFITEDIFQTWDTTTSQWNNYFKYTYEYTTINSKELLSQSTYFTWNTFNNQWDSSRVTIYSYNTNGLKTLELNKYYNNGNWLNSNQYVYEYDSVGNKTKYYFQVWDLTNNYWQNNTRTDYFWTAVTYNLVESATNNLFNIYPNPAYDYIRIASDKPLHNINIISLDGKTIISKKINSNGSIDISGLKSGIYMIKDDSGRSIGKFIKL